MINCRHLWLAHQAIQVSNVALTDVIPLTKLDVESCPARNMSKTFSFPKKYPHVVQERRICEQYITSKAFLLWSKSFWANFLPGDILKGVLLVT